MFQELTVQLYEWCRNLLDDEEAKIKMTGLDIDGNLIERATTMFKDKYPNVCGVSLSDYQTHLRIHTYNKLYAFSFIDETGPIYQIFIML